MIKVQLIYKQCFRALKIFFLTCATIFSNLFSTSISTPSFLSPYGCFLCALKWLKECNVILHLKFILSRGGIVPGSQDLFRLIFGSFMMVASIQMLRAKFVIWLMILLIFDMVLMRKQLCFLKDCDQIWEVCDPLFLLKKNVWVNSLVWISIYDSWKVIDCYIVVRRTSTHIVWLFTLSIFRPGISLWSIFLGVYSCTHFLVNLGHHGSFILQSLCSCNS